MDIRATMQSTLHSARQDLGERADRRAAADWVGVGALTALVAAGYTVFVLAQYYTFRTSADDLLIFDEAVRSYAHFKPGTTIFLGFHLGFGPNFSILGNHWSPILMSLAPLYWIFDSPLTLLVAQAVLFALAIPSLWVFTRRAFGGGGKASASAYLVCAAYALSWPIASALAFQFHEVAFVPMLTAVALERLQAGRLRPALIALGILLLVKEDMGLYIAGIGIYLAVSRPLVSRQRLVALGLVVVGLAYSWLATDVLVPAFGGRANFYWAYDALGSNIQQAAWHLLAHPGSSLRLLITPQAKLDTMLWLFGAFCFLSLLSPISLAAVPFLLERMLASTSSNWWVTSFQYNAFLVVILLCAAVDGAARLERWAGWARQRRAVRRIRPVAAGAAQPATDDAAAETAAARAAGEGAPADSRSGTVGTAAGGTVGTAAGGTVGTTPADAGKSAAPTLRSRGTGVVALVCAGAMFLLGLYLVPRFAFGPALHPSFYHRNARREAAAAADAVVPSGVTVEAVPFLGPQLASRDLVLLWDGDGGTPPTYAPWVVANIRQLQFSFHSVQEQKQRVAQLEHDGYQIVFRSHGYLVLHRVGPGTTGG